MISVAHAAGPFQLRLPLPLAPQPFFPTSELNFLSLSHRRCRVGEDAQGYRRWSEQRRAQETAGKCYTYTFCQVTASSARVAGHGDLAEAARTRLHMHELACSSRGRGCFVYTPGKRHWVHTRTRAKTHNVKILSQIYERVSDISRFHTSRDRRLAVSKGQDAQSFPGICFYQPICSLLD